MSFFVYLLLSTNKSTYIGATVNLDRRLRQHNGEIVGGAKATKIALKKGQVWERACYVSGFPSWQCALQFEWKWKNLGKKISKKMNLLERKIRALDLLLELDKSTSNAIPFNEWSTKPEVFIELDEIYNFY